MADIAAGIPWADMAQQLLSALRGKIDSKVHDFLDTHKDVADFLKECTEQLARALYMRAIESDPSKFDERAATVDALQTALKEQTFSMMLDIEHDGKSLVMTILETFFDVAIPAAKIALKVALL